MPPRTQREYTRLPNAISPTETREEAMKRVVDVLWEAFADQGLSWIGFYTASGEAPEEMILGARRDKPACSPIGMHGACGQCYLSRRALVVTDVAKLGEGYIACDPRDRSEVVVPCIDVDGTCWGVLDADSFDVNAFTMHDALSLMKLLRHAKLSFHGDESPSMVQIV
jgi:putative methionine-R-sulfoxide reductase with GAF domain